MKSNIEYRGVDFTVRWDYTPGEDQSENDRGCQPEAEIIEVKHKDTDFTQFMSEDDIVKIELILLK